MISPSGWFPCERCGGLRPGVDPDTGEELPGPPVKLTRNGYLCGPCRGLPAAKVKKLTTNTGQAAVMSLAQRTALKKFGRPAA
uniref:hypothetical protein n=1 Tax=Pseudonocardia sp. CA-138482 TaxID=3240023 RepID=UPI003F49095F